MIAHSSPWIDEVDRRAVCEHLDSGMLASGDASRELEGAIARYIGAIDQARSTASGTDALRLALVMAGVGCGDKVALPSYVCHDVADSIEAVGAEPVLCDVGSDGNLTLDTVAAVLNDRVRAIVAVHIFGRGCDVNALKSFGVPVIEDACQAFGATTSAGRAGSLGDLAVLSFHATKCLAAGEGGMVLRPTGSRIEWTEDKAAPRLSDLAASLALSQLQRYDAFLERRDAVAQQYDAAFADLPSIKLPARSGFRFRYVIGVNGNPKAWIEKAEKQGVALRRGVDSLLHRRAGSSDETFPQAVTLFNTNLSIPFYPALTAADVEQVIGVVRAVASEFDGV